MHIGLVLSGGGTRGVAHIGVIKALEEHNIHPTHIAGTSAGAIVGGMYAYGCSYKAIFKFFKDTNALDITKYAINKPGFIDSEKFYADFKTYIKNDDFKFLKKELYITATDILEGTLKIFDQGELIKPILASATVPGIFAPLKIGHSYYIDGGILNNFPVDVLRDKCDKIIGVNINAFEKTSIKDLKHSYSIIERAFKLKFIKEDREKFKDCDLLIAPKALSKYGTFDKKNLDRIFKLGYDATIKALEDSKIF